MKLDNNRQLDLLRNYLRNSEPQMKEDKDVSFERSINGFTLFFYDEKYEAEFQENIAGGRYFSPIFKYIAYPIIATFLAHRVCALISAYTSNFMTNAGKSAELFMVVLQAAMLILELIIKLADRWKIFAGFFFMTSFKLLIFMASFNTYPEPALNLAYTMCLTLLFPFSLMFSHTWMMMSVSGLPAMVYIVVGYIQKYSDVTSTTAASSDIVLALVALVYPIKFLYALEKSYRKLYFLEQEMKKSKKRWKSALDCLPVGIVMTNTDNKPEFLNKEALKYLLMRDCRSNNTSPLNRCMTERYDANNAFSPPVSSRTIVPLNSGDESCTNAGVDPFRMLVDSTGITLKTALERETGDETCEQVYNMKHIRTNKVYEVKTKLASNYKIAVVKDQTAHEQLVKEQVLQKYLRMLLSSISHEVRNPLNFIAGYVSMISESKDVASIKKNITKLQYAAWQIDYIINGACCLVMTEDYTLLVQPEEFNLTDVVKEVIEMMSCNINKGKVDMSYNHKNLLPPVIFSDKAKYKLILFYLLANAIKYTQAGSITVHLSFDSDTSVLSTTVQDTGCGIGDEKMSTLFQLYGGISSANEYNPQGMGLGLSLCKRLSKALGGEITVSSKVRVGTSFTFTVPNYGSYSGMMQNESFPRMETSNYDQRIKMFVPKSNAMLREPRKTEETHVDCKCTHALIVDDEALNRLVIKSYLNSIGIAVDEAEHGLAALDQVAKKSESTCCRKYQLIVMDINMPVMDGTTATQKLLEVFERDADIKAPIITVTAANMQSKADIKAMLSIGFVDIMQKPIRKEDFLKRVCGYFA